MRVSHICDTCTEGDLLMIDLRLPDDKAPSFIDITLSDREEGFMWQPNGTPCVYLGMLGYRHDVAVMLIGGQVRHMVDCFFSTVLSVGGLK